MNLENEMKEMFALQVPYETMVDKLWKHEELPDMYHHCAVGIVGEVIELYEAERRWANGTCSRRDIIEELGDLCFFVTRALMWNDLALASYSDLPKELDSDLLFDAGEMMDVTKRFKVYGKPLETERWGRHLTRVAICLHAKLRLHNVSLDEALHANQTKLLTGEKARYKLGLFTQEQAQERADKAGS